MNTTTEKCESAAQALRWLVDGNARYVQGESTLKITAADRRNVADGQQPFAVILGCSDSRVPTEVVFDQGVGALFVIRVAGNIVQPSQIGSVEFAAQKFGTRLVVVLGHTQCGAIEATIEELLQPAEKQSRNLASIVSRIRPSVENLLGQSMPRDELVHRAVRENIRYSVDALRHGSEIIESACANDELMIVGAEYSLQTGVVDFFDVDAGTLPAD
jgi:carbonic anhydrase